MKILYSLIILILIMPLLFAYEPHKQNTDYLLIISSNNATNCYVNSIGNKTNINLQMNKYYQDFSLNINKSNFTILKDICINVRCTDGISNETGSKCITITQSGYEISTPKVIVIFFIIGCILLVSIIFFIFGLKSEYPPVKLFCNSITVILIIFLIGYVLSISNTLIGEYSNINDNFSVLYVLFIILLIVGGFGLMIYLIVFSLQAFAKYRGFRD